MPPQSFDFQERPSETRRAFPSDLPSGSEVGATVKWFNAEKGFGFVSPQDGSADAFLHINVLRRAGHEQVNEGDVLRVKVGPGQRGVQVTEVLGVKAGEAPAIVARPARAVGRPDAGPTTEVRGKVKWFSEIKGFGFVTPDDGGKDVFLHIRCLERNGLRALAENTAVVMQVQQAEKGREARSVALG